MLLSRFRSHPSPSLSSALPSLDDPLSLALSRRAIRLKALGNGDSAFFELFLIIFKCDFSFKGSANAAFRYRNGQEGPMLRFVHTNFVLPLMPEREFTQPE